MNRVQWPFLIVVPDRLTVCVPSGALSVMLSVVVRVPRLSAKKYTLIVQLLPAPRDVPQKLRKKKSSQSALVSVSDILLMVRLLVPVFCSVTLLDTRP